MKKKIDIISGFLGAGKTTLIQRLFEGPYKNKKIAVIENDFGEAGLDGAVLRDTGSTVKEIVSGCICCTLIVDFQAAIESLAADDSVDRIVIEPSGVAKLSDVVRACGSVSIGRRTTVVDPISFAKYADHFGEFFFDQVRHAGTIVISKIGTAEDNGDSVKAAVDLVKRENGDAEIISVPWESRGFADFLDRWDRETGSGDFDTEPKPVPHCSDASDEFISITFIPDPEITASFLRSALEGLNGERTTGTIARIKGIVETVDEGTVKVDWSYGSFGVVQTDIRAEKKLTIIGKGLIESELHLFFTPEMESPGS